MKPPYVLNKFLNVGLPVVDINKPANKKSHINDTYSLVIRRQTFPSVWLRLAAVQAWQICHRGYQVSANVYLSNTVTDCKLNVMTLTECDLSTAICNWVKHYLCHCRGLSMVGANYAAPISSHWLHVKHVPVKNSSRETGQRSALIVLHSNGVGETDWPSSVQTRAEMGRGRKPANVSQRRS